jgi:hypothetical protein
MGISDCIILVAVCLARQIMALYSFITITILVPQPHLVGRSVLAKRNRESPDRRSVAVPPERRVLAHPACSAYAGFLAHSARTGSNSGVRASGRQEPIEALFLFDHSRRKQKHRNSGATRLACDLRGENCGGDQ